MHCFFKEFRRDDPEATHAVRGMDGNRCLHEVTIFTQEQAAAGGRNQGSQPQSMHYPLLRNTRLEIALPPSLPSKSPKISQHSAAVHVPPPLVEDAGRGWGILFFVASGGFLPFRAFCVEGPQNLMFVRPSVRLSVRPCTLKSDFPAC